MSKRFLRFASSVHLGGFNLALYRGARGDVVVAVYESVETGDSFGSFAFGSLDLFDAWFEGLGEDDLSRLASVRHRVIRENRRPTDDCSGVGGLQVLSLITGVSVQTLINWRKSRPTVFRLLVAGAELEVACDGGVE